MADSYNKNIKFFLLYTDGLNNSRIAAAFAEAHFKIPNRIIVLKDLLERGGVSPSQIIIQSLDDLNKKNRIENFISSIKDGAEHVFLLSPMGSSRYQLNICFRIAKIIKKRFCNSRVIIGGILPTVAPEIFMKRKIIDMVVLGEAETFFPYFLKFLEKKIKDVPGAHVLKSGDYVWGGKREVASPKKIYMSQQVIIRERVKNPQTKNKTLFLEFGRGCLFNCAFCYRPLIRKNLELRAKDFLRVISPQAAASLLKTAAKFGFKNIVIADDSWTSFPPDWFKTFMANIRRHFLRFRNDNDRNEIFLVFFATLTDFQKDYVKKFFKGMTNFFALRPLFGLEALDKESLVKFNKPHKYDYQKYVEEILDFTKLFGSNRRFLPTFFTIYKHPWINFKKWRKLLAFWRKYRMWPFSYGWELDLGWGARIDDTLQKDNLLVDKEKYRFVYAKGVLIPKNKDDTDIGRFIYFLKKINKVEGVSWPTISIYEKRFACPLLEGWDKVEKIKEKTLKNLYSFFLSVLNEAEQEWPRLSWSDCSKKCNQRVKQFSSIIFSAK